MQFPDRALFVWLGLGRVDDPKYLLLWRQSPLSFSPKDTPDYQWNDDRYEISLGKDQTGKLFERAARLVMANQFYPEVILTSVSDFDQQKRPPQIGDRIVQRIRVMQIAGKPVMEVLAMNEITQVIQEERQVGFTYTTTCSHYEIGEWSPKVEWSKDGDVVLTINVLSRVKPGLHALTRRLTREMQLRAHHQSIAHFQSLLGYHPSPTHSTQLPSIDLLPASFCAAACFFFFFALIRQKNQRR